MWSKTYSKKVKNIHLKDLWNVCIDINNWAKWHDDIEYATVMGEVKEGNMFILKPQNGPKVNIKIIEVTPYSKFVDMTKFPFAKMYGVHEFIQIGNEVEIKNTMQIDGVLSFLWRKLVAEKVADNFEQQTLGLINRAKLMSEGR